jgi:small-conductance mechanosensitive channel
LETALNKYGIEIPFPQRDLHIRSGLPAASVEPEVIGNPALTISNTSKPD